MNKSKSVLILASRSPRRRQLLTDAGYEFRVIPPSETAECGICSRETPPELVARLAFQKAQDVAQRVNSGILIGCDTVVECRGQILTKPLNRVRAGEMLRLLCGQVHHVYSGLCLWRRPRNKCRVDVAVSKLRMKPLTNTQVDEYLDTEAWQGKAGGFGLQDQLGWLEVLAGSESNVVGLPLEMFAEMLREVETEV